VACTREATHAPAGRGHQDLGRPQPAPRDGLPVFPFVPKGAQPRLDLRADCGDDHLQLLDVGYLLGQEKALVRPDLPAWRGGSRRSLVP
jgi:hypothetical protein